jgi:hypothetical protein
MTHHLAWIESRDATTIGRATAPGLDAAALRRDIAEAQMHIDRLYRRYLSGGERIQQRALPEDSLHPPLVAAIPTH